MPGRRGVVVPLYRTEGNTGDGSRAREKKKRKQLRKET